MNERIDQISDQVMCEFRDAFDSMTCDGEYIPDEFFERFAELIVRECAAQVDHVRVLGGGLMGDLIREHFGVE